MAILSTKGIKPEMKFVCSVCHYEITGQNILDGEHLHIVKANKENPEKSIFRCECCHEEWLESRMDSLDCY